MAYKQCGAPTQRHGGYGRLGRRPLRNGSVQAVEDSHDLSVQGIAIMSAYHGSLTMRWTNFTVASVAVKAAAACTYWLLLDAL